MTSDPAPIDPNQLARILALSKSAGDRVLSFYHTGCDVTLKPDDSPLTQADQASHRHIVEALRKLTPEIPVVSEESDPAERNVLAGAGEFWLVDPLDGTKEFLKKSGEFTVNIALIRDHRPVLGVVHAPAMGLSYYADATRGAWKENRSGQLTSMRCRPANPRHLSVVASKDHAGPRVTKMLSKIPGAELVSMGSSLKFCLVAEGKADLYPRFVGTMEWDTAAAQCVVETAGGAITDTAGTPLRYGKPEWRNPAIMTVGDTSLRWADYI